MLSGGCTENPEFFRKLLIRVDKANQSNGV
jgi:hypothetical protein